METTPPSAYPSTPIESKSLCGNSISQTHRVAQCGGHAVPLHPLRPLLLHHPQQRPGSQVSGSVLVPPGIVGSRTKTVSTPAARTLRLSSCPSSSPDAPAFSPDTWLQPQQLSRGGTVSHWHPAQSPRLHPYFFATLQPRRLLPLRWRGHWGGSPRHRLRCICASVDRTRAARSAFIENHLRKRMARTMVRSWTRKRSHLAKRPTARNAVGALSCAPSALEN